MCIPLYAGIDGSIYIAADASCGYCVAFEMLFLLIRSGKDECRVRFAKVREGTYLYGTDTISLRCRKSRTGHGLPHLHLRLGFK